MTRAGKRVLTNSRRLTNIKTADVTGNASPQVIPKFNTQMIRVVSLTRKLVLVAIIYSLTYLVCAYNFITNKTNVAWGRHNGCKFEIVLVLLFE